MNNNVDVVKELAVKNREIYLNKLSIDIDNNTSNEIEIFHNVIHDELQKLINKRADVLKETIKKIDKIDYKDILDKETNELFDNLEIIYSQNVEQLINKLLDNYNLFEKNRLSDYLENINYKRFIARIKEIIINMNYILYNSYLESKEKYMELNKKVVN